MAAANDGQPDPARRVATAVCVYARQAFLNPTQGRVVAKLQLEGLSTTLDVNARVVQDLRDGIARGRLAVLTLEAGVTFIIGTVQALIGQIVADPDLAWVIQMSQHFVTLILRAFGLPPLEAEMIALESAEKVIRGTV